MITPAPDPTLLARQAATTIYPYILTGYIPAQDPDLGPGTGCSCDNWVSVLPTLAGTQMCVYSTQTGPPNATTSTASTSFDTTVITSTSTLLNGGEVAYWLSMPTTANQYDAGPFAMTTMEPISTSSLYSGKVMTVQMASTNSVNVGTLSGTLLYTAVFNALMSACTEVPPPLPTSGLPTASVTTCGEVPKITGIMFSDSTGLWTTCGELELAIPMIQYYDMQSPEGMVASIANAANGSSLNPSSTWSPSDNCSWPVGGFGEECDADAIGGVYPDSTVNIPAMYQAIYTQHTR